MSDKNTSLNTIIKNRNLLIVAVIAMTAFIILIVTSSFSFQAFRSSNSNEEIILNMWGVWDESRIIQDYIREFEQQNANIEINYRNLTIQNYERELINAMATGRGPDIFAMHHTWLGKHKSLMQPAPEDIMELSEYRDRFVDVVYDDFVEDEKIWGFPLYTDNLALFYNKDAFNDASITQPPTTWEEFQDDVRTLTRIDQFGDIQLAGASLGTGQNINRAPDIVSLLMLQSGVEMTNPENPSTITINRSITNAGRALNPAEQSLKFYTDFSNPRTDVYTWNVAQDYNVDAFYERELAMMFGYSYQVEQINSKAPRLNWGIAKLPQISSNSPQINYANYWGYTTSVQSQYPEESYRFLKFLTEQERAQDYFLRTKRPTARRDLVDSQSNDFEYGIFVQQVIQAKSWRQPNNDAIDQVIIEVLEEINRGALSYEAGVKRIQAEAQVLADDIRDR